MKKFLLPLGAGVVVFGVATAFAATLTVNSKSLGAGSASVTSCNSSANVSYNTTAGSSNNFIVTTAPVTSAASCANMSFQVSLYDGSGATLGSVTGTLSATGTAAPDFTSDAIDASSVQNVAVVITG